jgi:hypothetical protein
VKNDDDDLWDDEPDLLNGLPRRLARTKMTLSNNHDGRHIGCPIWWLKRVYPVAKSKGELAVALYLYRLRSVNGRKTVTVPNGWLRKELGIDRYTKYRALDRYAKAKLIRVRRRGRGALQITFLARGV